MEETTVWLDDQGKFSKFYSQEIRGSFWVCNDCGSTDLDTDMNQDDDYCSSCN